MCMYAWLRGEHVRQQAARTPHERLMKDVSAVVGALHRPGKKKEATDDLKGRRRTPDQSSEHELHHIQEYGVWAYNTGIKHSVSKK